MNIVTALNKKYIPYTTVMLLSVGMNEDEPVTAYLLNSELDDDDIHNMESVVSKYDVRVVSVFVDRNIISDRMPYTDQWSIEIYYRLMMQELLPDSLERALYLDGDIIVNKSLLPLYHIEFEGKEIIACDDKSGFNEMDNYGPKHREMFREAYEKGFRYFNSGVMLYNLEEMRKKYSFQTYIDAMEKWNFEMEAPDQDILNYVHWEKVGFVDCNKYDLFARFAHNAGATYNDVKNEVSIIHYAGSKPWEGGGFHFDIEKIWWDYAKSAPFYEELLKNFIAEAINDTSVSDYLKMLHEENQEQKRVIGKIMEKVESLLK